MHGNHWNVLTPKVIYILKHLSFFVGNKTSRANWKWGIFEEAFVIVQIRNLWWGNRYHLSKKYMVLWTKMTAIKVREIVSRHIFKAVCITWWYGGWDKERTCGWVLGFGVRNWVNHGNICQFGETKKGRRNRF